MTRFALGGEVRQAGRPAAAGAGRVSGLVVATEQRAQGDRAEAERRSEPRKCRRFSCWASLQAASTASSLTPCVIVSSRFRMTLAAAV